MHDLHSDAAQERQWAAKHFRGYHLGQLDSVDEERLATAVAEIPGLVDELEQSEEELLDDGLDRKLTAEDQLAFKRQYEDTVEGNEEKRVKLQLHRVLRLPDIKKEFNSSSERESNLPVVSELGRRRNLAPWALAAAASVVACIFGIRWYQGLERHTAELAGLETQIDSLRNQLANGHGRGTDTPVVAGGPKANQHAAAPKPKKEREDKPEEERLAGGVSAAFQLPHIKQGESVQVVIPGAPESLKWSLQQGDDLGDYMIEVSSNAGSAESTLNSGPLSPEHNSVTYKLGDPHLPLPWTVKVYKLNAAGETVGLPRTYKLVHKP